MPRHIWEPIAAGLAKQWPRTTVSTGWAAGHSSSRNSLEEQSVSMVANPSYWGWNGEEPPIDRIVFQLFTNPDAMVAAFQNGELDVAERRSPGDGGVVASRRRDRGGGRGTGWVRRAGHQRRGGRGSAPSGAARHRSATCDWPRHRSSRHSSTMSGLAMVEPIETISVPAQTRSGIPRYLRISGTTSTPIWPTRSSTMVATSTSTGTGSGRCRTAPTRSCSGMVFSTPTRRLSRSPSSSPDGWARSGSVWNLAGSGQRPVVPDHHRRHLRHLLLGLGALRRSGPIARHTSPRPSWATSTTPTGPIPAYDELYLEQNQELDPDRRVEIVHEMVTLFHDAAIYFPMFLGEADLQAYRIDRFEGWVRQPADTGPIIFSNTSPSYALADPDRGGRRCRGLGHQLAALGRHRCRRGRDRR